MKTKSGVSALLALVLVLSLVSWAATPSQADTLPNARINGTDCDLIDAITSANSDTATGDCAAGTAGADTIELLDNVTLTVINNEQNGLPKITSVITIAGHGYTIARASGAPQFRIMWVDYTGNLTLNDTTISGGYFAPGSGWVGGGIFSVNTLTLNNSTVSGNAAGNSAGGIATSGVLTLNYSTVSGNSGDNNGSGGGIENFGTATIANSTVSGNSIGSGGGGIKNDGDLTIINSTITGNNASTGGGIWNGGTLTLSSSLTAGNAASTVAEIYNSPGYCDEYDPDTCWGVGLINADSFNLFGHSGETNAAAFSGFAPGASDITATSNGATSTALASILNTTLASNGGPTLTHALVSGSPAVDAAPSGPAVDQRGVSRPQGPAYDIGAYELEQSSNQSPTLAADSASVTVDEGQTATNSGTVSDSDGDTVTLTASAGTVVNNNDGTWSWSFATSDGPAESQTVTIDAADGNGGAAQTSFALTVDNVEPTVNAGPDQTVYRNDLVTVSGSWTDPAGAADNAYTWAWDLDGDGYADDFSTANYGDTIVRTTSFAVDGVATLTFVVLDKDGLAVYAGGFDTAEINVINRAPVANSQSLSTDEDTPLPVALTAGDADNDILTYTVLTTPGNGALSGTAPNLTYTPDADYFGSDSFTFQVSDGLVASNIATISIAVNSVNDPVVAVDDTVSTDEDTAVTIPVQDNDSAGPANENPALTTTAVTNPTHGAAAINPNGSVTYTPDLNYNGSDSFDYTVCDSDGSCDSAKVTVLVEMVNDPPVAVDDSASTYEDMSVSVNAVANDSDVDGSLVPGSAQVVSGPTDGSVVDNGNGSFTYTPNANFSGTDSFVYQVCDNDGACATATVTITVIHLNNAPVCTSVSPSVSVLWPPNHQFEPVTVNGVTDIDGDTITISITSIRQDEPTNGTGDGDTSPDGQGLGSSTAQVRSERKGNGNGRFYHISFSATDGHGGNCTGVVKVSVPKNQSRNGAAVDDGPLYDSTLP